MMNNLKADMPTSCLVVEDNLRTREVITTVLREKFKNLQLLEAGNLAAAETMFSTHLPQLLLLDINLPDGNSFEFLEKHYRERSPGFKVIFITAYADYALEAFRYSALDFLLKPFAPSELEDSVTRALDNLQQQNYYLQLEAFFQNYKQGEAPSAKKIVLKTAENIYVIPARQVCYAQADNNYTLFVLEGHKKILVSQPLKTWEENLAPLGFIRIHQSYLVNVQYIRAYRKKEGLLVLEDGNRIPVSQNRKATLMAYLNTL
ncbi:LytTR family DNA-binding domain-containing protein [Sinomicrobium kalidii]|uniref:LytR/AlgR family response regulator transcription factor n=1 Tax=Sinomicrobium kalidii TaxID=2900738 RepID=UPI001E40B5AE|nr:LytTR family DNA-binding domain-containing protein [Sinomicrobium kalidii]UGU17815.1 LytTR family DNA-binding domain-containing protein [Sinomicrobium kalidii]